MSATGYRRSPKRRWSWLSRLRTLLRRRSTSSPRTSPPCRRSSRRSRTRPRRPSPGSGQASRPLRGATRARGPRGRSSSRRQRWRRWWRWRRRGSQGSGGWCRPHGGGKSSGYGPRSQQCGPQGCSSSFHYGTDFANGCGAAIYAAQSGTVDYAGGNGGYGNYIRIQHGGGIGTGYAHIRNGGILVRSGQWVRSGQVIAYAGNTGRSFGCHLHFEVYVNGQAVNPVQFLARHGVSA
ncbi:M23 family metallopeptidase [Microbacterium sp. Se63.02b]|uniref:M23 family metallopeptidase n=1 Tax=Microbacterium sp. Se63.02b TaxID=2709304 RepID=UPI0031F718EF